MLYITGMWVAGLPTVRFKHPKEWHKQQLSEEYKRDWFPEVDRTIGQSATEDNIYRKGEARARNEQSGWIKGLALLLLGTAELEQSLSLGYWHAQTLTNKKKAKLGIALLLTDSKSILILHSVESRLSCGRYAEHECFIEYSSRAVTMK